MASAASTGRKLQDQADKVSKATDPGLTTHASDGEALSFPRDFDAGSEQWKKEAALKLKLGDGEGNTPLGALTVSERDLQNILAIEDAEKEIAFDEWFGKNFNKNDLATRRLAQELNPDYYATRAAKMTARAKMALRIKLIQLRGPRDEEDLKLYYGIQTGAIQLGKDWDRIGATEAFDADTAPGNMRKKVLGLQSRMFQPVSGYQASAANNPSEIFDKNWKSVFFEPSDSWPKNTLDLFSTNQPAQAQAPAPPPRSQFGSGGFGMGTV